MRRRTKIICTIGPASNDWETLRAMQAAGMDVVRINMSHATHEDAAKTVAWVRTLNRRIRHTIPIMLDTSGPEIRTGVRAEPLELVQDAQVIVNTKPTADGCEGRDHLQVEYDSFEDTVKVGDTIRIDNGLINVEVVQRLPNGLLCRVEDGGELGSRRHVNLPGVHLDLPSVSTRDKEDVAFAKEYDLDFVAQSFVRTADDIQVMRNLLGRSHQWVQIIAKIENQEGVVNADSIAQESFGIMVARGDLGIETDIARLPGLQRQLVQRTLQAGRRCIVATHLLESMVENPIPTRAEVVDVANAIYEGADAVLLSSETSIGQRPTVVVEQMRRICEESERVPSLNFTRDLKHQSVKQDIARSAGELAERVGAMGLVVITRSGLMADLVTNCAPLQVPIFAFTNLSHTRRRLALNRGVFAYRVSFNNNPEKTIKTILSALRVREGLSSDSRVVVISDVLSSGGVDSIQVRTVGEEAATS